MLVSDRHGGIDIGMYIKKALFSAFFTVFLSLKERSPASGNPSGLDITKSPGKQNTNEQQNRQAHTKRERLRHVVGLAVVVLLVLFAPFEHKKHGKT